MTRRPDIEIGGWAKAARVEFEQEPDGSVTVPETLRPYMGGVERIGGPE